MNEEFDKFINKLNPNIRKLIDEFGFKIEDIKPIEKFEVSNNKLVIWCFNESVTDKKLCDILLDNPQIDTLFLGKDVTDNKDGQQINQIHILLTSSHNIVPTIQNIELEDNRRYCVVDGMLIDKKTGYVIDYASGRMDKCLHIPNGIVGLMAHCFTYNKFVSELEIPTSLNYLDGLKSLPYLKHISLHGPGTSIFTIDDDILYEKKGGFNAITFIPPYHSIYMPALRIKSLLSDLYQSIHGNAESGQWENVSAENFNYDEKYGRINIKYYGGFYEQEWYIIYEELPTKLCIGYNLWQHWRQECYFMFEYRDDIEKRIRYNCRKCSAKDNCNAIYKSNIAYINKLCAAMKRILDEKSMVIDKDNSYISLDISLDITQNPSEIKRIVVAFLDIALRLRDIYPVCCNHLQPLKISEGDVGLFPFNYRYNNEPLGYVNVYNCNNNEDIVPF